MMRTRFAHPIRASSPPGLHQQAGHMTASDLCAARQMISCQAGPSTHEPPRVHHAVLLRVIGPILGWADRKGSSDCADEVTLSLKGANSPMRGRKLRSTGTKAKARVSNGPDSLTELKKQLEARTRELAEARGHLSEALEQQTATSEVLRVISSSPGELEPVFQPMLANAIRLCEASYGAMWLREGDSFRNAAFHGLLPAEYVEIWRSATVPIGSAVLFGPLVQSRRPVQVADLTETRAYLDGHQLPVAAADVAGIRTMVGVPMFKNDDLIGAIVIYRQEVR